MTDDIKELLTLAAKAAGICAIGFHEKLGVEHIDGSDDSPYTTFWNPLIDDGDALRLAVKLQIDVQFFTEGESTSAVQVEHCGYRCNIGRNEVKPEGNIYAATRRAIVRAAAEIGKGMK